MLPAGLMLPDYRTPSPDEGHEAIRRPLAEAIDNLDAQVERLDDAFLLLQTTVDFAQSTLSTVLAGQKAIADLARRVAQLEALTRPEPDPSPAPEPEPASDGQPEDLTDNEEMP